ncbi:MAG: InlB B-repeat-containing protein [Bacilli bacterium]
MKTKISMKTIYLILVISIGLIVLGIGSTYAVFTVSAEISNPISFSSNLSYKADIFDTADITIGPNSSKDVNFAIFNEDEQIEGVNYATWYIYDGDSSDLVFSVDTSSYQDAITLSGELDTWGGVIYMTVTNNTSNTITFTMGVATSKDEIVLPSYMKLVTITAPSTYTLNLNKGTGVSKIYYKINGASSYTSSTSNISLSVNSGSTYYYYGTSSKGYGMSSCTSSSPCSGTMGTSAVTKTLSATKNTYIINYDANGGTGAPNSQIKTYGTTLTLSSVQPIKIGYPFIEWNTNQDGSGTVYQSGGSYTTNANATLYAQYSTTLTNYTVYLDVIDTGESYQDTVKHGDEYSKDISTMASGVDITCTNGENFSDSSYNNVVSIVINQVTSDISCEVQWWDY